MASTSTNGPLSGGYYTDNFGWVSISERLKQQVAGLNLQNIQDVNNKSASDNVSPLSDKGSIWVGGGGNAVDVIDITAGDNESFLIADSTDDVGWRLSNDPDNIVTNEVSAKIDDLALEGNLVKINAAGVVISDGNEDTPDVYATVSEDFIDLKKQVNVGPDSAVFLNTNYTTPTRMYFGNEVLDRKIVLHSVADNIHQFYGLGLVSNTFKMQLPSNDKFFSIYSGNGPSSSTLVHDFRGDGRYSMYGDSINIRHEGGQVQIGLEVGCTFGKIGANGSVWSTSQLHDCYISATGRILLGANAVLDVPSMTLNGDGSIDSSGQINVNLPNAYVGTKFTTPTLIAAGDNNMNRKIVLGGTADNDHQFYGFGKNDNELRVQLLNSSANLDIYVGAGTSSSSLVARFLGTGGLSLPAAADSYNAPLTIYKHAIVSVTRVVFGTSTTNGNVQCSRINNVVTISWLEQASTGTGDSVVFGDLPSEFRTSTSTIRRFPVWMQRNSSTDVVGYCLMDNSGNITFTTLEPYVSGTSRLYPGSITFHRSVNS